MKSFNHLFLIPSVPPNASEWMDEDVNHTLKTPRLSLVPKQMPLSDSEISNSKFPNAFSHCIIQIQESLDSYLFWSIQLVIDDMTMQKNLKTKKKYPILNEDPFKLPKSVQNECIKTDYIPESIGWITLSAQGHLTLFIRPNYTCQGYATEALKSILTFGFLYLKLNLISLLVSTDPALERVGEKMGMKRMNTNYMNLTHSDFKDLWILEEE